MKERSESKITKLFKLPRHYLAYKMYSKQNNLQGMYRNLNKLSPVYRRTPSFYYRLSKLAFRQKLWQQALNNINVAIKLADENTPKMYYKCKAECLIELGESEQAVSYIGAYLLVNPKDTKAWLKQANEYVKLRLWKDAINGFEAYLELQPENSLVCYQLGECYQQINDRDSAENYYQQATNNLDNKSIGQSLAKAHYKLGLMQLKNEKFEQATKSFNTTIKLDQKLNSRRWGIGVFHEHYKEWTYAITAYENQLKKKGKDAELHFKLASMLDYIYQTEQAIVHYKDALNLDRVQSKWHFALANCYEQLADYQNAVKWYKSAIIRQQNHSPGNYKRLGFCLDQLGQSKEALEIYKEAELFRRPSVVGQKLYKKIIKKREVRYAISYEHYQVNNKMIFYESLGGARMMGNPYAIFENIYASGDFNDYIHVWVVGSYSVIPNQFRNKDNIIFVKRDSDAYMRYIASAKYLICNSTFEDFVTRKSEQLYLQTSHGIFYKTVGRDSSRSPVGVAGSTRNLLQATHIIVPNEFMAEKQPKAYSIEGIHAGEIAKIGYPRIDVTLNLPEETKNHIFTKLNLNPTKQSIFYAPTWRGITKAKNKFDSSKLIDDLTKLSNLDVNVIFRGHPITNRLLKGVKFPENIILPSPDIQTNELLNIADILITDYSSVFFDFIPTEKPIIHYLYDVEEYTKERGLNLPEEDLPGFIAKNSKELIEYVNNGLKNNEPSSRYLDAKKRFCPYDDGASAERVIRWFFHGDDSHINIVPRKGSRDSLLYLGGVLSDQARVTEMVTELNEHHKNGDSVSIMLRRSVEKDENKLSMIQKLNTSTNLVAHAGKMPITPIEAAAINYFKSNRNFANKEMEAAYKKSFKREARRLFGDSLFDQVSNFETDSDYWNSLADGIQSLNQPIN